jgi:hypothetical protein
MKIENQQANPARIVAAYSASLSHLVGSSQFEEIRLPSRWSQCLLLLLHPVVRISTQLLCAVLRTGYTPESPVGVYSSGPSIWTEEEIAALRRARPSNPIVWNRHPKENPQ